MNSNKQKTQMFDHRHKKFLEDFCLLAQLTPEQQTQFQKTKIDNIEEEYEATLLKDHKGQKYSLGRPIEDFQHYGPGIYLLFKFLKVCTILFVVVSIFASANLIILSRGTQYLSHTKSMQFKIKLGLITFGNIKKQYDQLVPAISFAGFVLFTLGIILWKQKQMYEVINCSKVRLLSSYYTVILKQIPKDYSESELKEYLQEFGDVKQIFSVKSFNDDLSYYQEMNQIIASYKQKKNMLKLHSQTQNSLKLCNYFTQFYNLYRNKLDQKPIKYEPNFAFITFTNIISRQILLETMQNSQRFLCFKSDECRQQSLYKGQKLKFKECKIEPDSINWQNICISMKSKFLRILLQMSLLVLVLILSIIIIYFFAITQISLTGSKYSSLTREQIIDLNDRSALKYYCLSLSITKFYHEDMCQPYRGIFIKVIMLQMLLPVIIAFLKFVFVGIMRNVVQLRKHPTYIEKIESQMVITFLFYFTVVGILQFIINIEIKTQSSIISIEKLMKYCFPFYQQILPTQSAFANHEDYNIPWYFFNSSQITLISIISFNVKAVFSLLFSLIRRCVCQHLAKKQQLNVQKMKYLKGENLQIQYIYACALNIIAFTLLFSPVIPVIWIFGAFSFFVLYWTHKYIFITFCQVPFVFSHSINHLVVRLILLTISLCSLTAPLLYGGVQGLSCNQRYKKYIYFPILSALIILYMFFKKFIIILIIKLRNKFSKNWVIRKNRLPSLICRIDEVNSKLPSYSMHENKSYESILKLMYIIRQDERKRNTFILNQNLNSFIQTNSKQPNQFNQFRELIQLIRQDRKKYERHQNNPFSNTNKEIQFIFKLNMQFRTLLYHNSKLPFFFSSKSSKNNVSIKSNIQSIDEIDKVKQSEKKSIENEDNICKQSQRQLNDIQDLMANQLKPEEAKADN